MPYEYQPYPKMLYARDGSTRIVNDPQEHEAAGSEWAETPAAFTEPEAPVAPPAPPAKPDKRK